MVIQQMMKAQGGQITRVLKQGFPQGFKGAYKVNIVGTTGSGKTRFLRYLLGDLFTPISEAPRRTETEKKVDDTYNWYRIGDKLKEESTTTLSLNTVGILLVRTLFNTIEFHPVDMWKELLLRDNIEEIWKFVFFDNAGQTRFDFMPQITMRGADAVIILADGTNMSSIEKIIYFLDMVHEEEERVGDQQGKLPVMILLNKKDLAQHGVFIGLDTVKRFIGTDPNIDFFETSMISGSGVDDTIRTLISRLN